MKLATYRDGSRDGQLLVVSRDLSLAHYATGIAHRLQQVLDDWNFLSPALQDLYETLNLGKARHAFEWDPRQCLAPLPRVFHRARARAWDPCDAGEPLQLHPLPGEPLWGAHARWPVGATAAALEVQAGLAAVVSDVPQGLEPAQAVDSVRLLMLHAELLPQALPDGGASPTGRPGRRGSLFGPVAVTPDELGPAWQDGRVGLTLACSLNGRRFAGYDAAQGMRHHFGDLIARACANGPLGAGAVLCAGPVRERDAAPDAGRLAWLGALELAAAGTVGVAGPRPGDIVTLDMRGRDGQSPLGQIVCEFVAAD